MGAIEMGLSEEELQPLVDSWRAANPNIVRFWWDVDRAVKKAVKDKEILTVKGINLILLHKTLEFIDRILTHSLAVNLLVGVNCCAILKRFKNCVIYFSTKFLLEICTLVILLCLFNCASRN